MIELIANKIFLDNDYEIREYDTDNGIVRALVSNECTQSLIYIDNNKRQELGIEYFNYYIDLRRGDFVGPNDDDYVTQFMGAVNNLIAQIYYVGNVSEAKNNEELLDLLDSGTEYTGISFSEFN